MSSSVDAKDVGLNQIAKGEEHQILREVLYAAAGKETRAYAPGKTPARAPTEAPTRLQEGL